MKVRTDFVTNSSSSSFILSFRDSSDLESFINKCKETRNKELIDIVGYAIKSNKSTKKELKQTLFDICARDLLDDVYEEIHPGYKELDIMKKIDIHIDCRNSEEFMKKLRKAVETKSEYMKLSERIDNDETVIYQTIWDTDGGIVESSIRDGLLKNDFKNWLIIQQDVG